MSVASFLSLCDLCGREAVCSLFWLRATMDLPVAGVVEDGAPSPTFATACSSRISGTTAITRGTFSVHGWRVLLTPDDHAYAHPSRAREDRPQGSKIRAKDGRFDEFRKRFRPWRDVVASLVEAPFG